MKVLFAINNENTSQSIIKKYQVEYKQIIAYKNVYYFNAIIKELQRDKTYDRIVISEDLEQYVNNDYEQMDKFLFDKLDSISDEASNIKGEEIPIILICTERRNKSEQILIKLFGIGIYNAIIGNDRSTTEVCRLINKPRSKKEAKIYYKIDADDVSYGKEDENDVSELEIQNILTHYKRIGNNENKYVESFNSIAEQYNDKQLKVISKCLPLNVRAVLEEKSEKYQQINSFNNKLSDDIRVTKKEEKPGTSEILLKNNEAKQLDKPVIIPSAIDTNKKKKILVKPKQYVEDKKQEPIAEKNNEEDLLQEIGFDVIEEKTKDKIELNEEIIQPVKRGRGRPKKTAHELVEEQPKRKRGRPKKMVETEDVTLPGFDDEMVEEETENTNYIENGENILPGFENANLEDETDEILPGFEDTQLEDENDEMLPGFEDTQLEDENDEILPGFEETKLENETDTILPEFDNESKDSIEYTEIDIESIMRQNQKLVAFVGTSKNGTSFLVNNVAKILSMNGIDTAILDLTQNRNSYYIYTKNDEQLRNQSNYITKNLKNGFAKGIQEHKNLTIYTSPFEGDEDIDAVEPIIETLVKQHTVVIMDCDFMTPMRYFKYAQEIYLVQSMDILTIQPLTAFVRKLIDKEMFDSLKTRVVLNKFVKTRELNESILIGGMSIYNDPGMTVRKELFDRKNVPSIVIPLDVKSYLKYLDGLVTCEISLKGYDKDFIASLKNLASMVYKIQNNKKTEKYMPPSVKNNNNGFSTRMNNTLDQMKKNY